MGTFRCEMSQGTEAATRGALLRKVFLEISQNLQEKTCARVPFLIKLQAQACNFIKKETLAQVFSCEFCEISKNTFSYRTPPVAAFKGNVQKTFCITLHSRLNKIYNTLNQVFSNIFQTFTETIVQRCFTEELLSQF